MNPTADTCDEMLRVLQNCEDALGYLPLRKSNGTRILLWGWEMHEWAAQYAGNPDFFGQGFVSHINTLLLVGALLLSIAGPHNFNFATHLLGAHEFAFNRLVLRVAAGGAFVVFGFIAGVIWLDIGYYKPITPLDGFFGIMILFPLVYLLNHCLVTGLCLFTAGCVFSVCPIVDMWVGIALLAVASILPALNFFVFLGIPNMFPAGSGGRGQRVRVNAFCEKVLDDDHRFKQEWWTTLRAVKERSA